MYPWLVFLHVIAIFGFLLTHGASASAAFALRRERNLERVRALLLLSASSYKLMYLSLLVLLVSGIVAGFIGKLWGYGWIWISLALLITIIAAMMGMGSRVYGVARKAAGLPYFDRGKEQPAVATASPAELDQALSKGNPVLLTVIGYGGVAVIAWLMMFKPF
jgi:small-conductance mechanosensitive channel